MILDVGIKDNEYKIVIDYNILRDIALQIKEYLRGNKVFIVTDDNVAKHYLKPLVSSLAENDIDVFYKIIPHGEKSKSMNSAIEIYDELMASNLKRKDMILVLGGGVMGDLGGFVSSTYLRGIDFIQIPTSLLAQIDSSIGGKVAVDLNGGKNLVGAFYQPKKVIIDIKSLETLSERYLRDGFCEVIKYALIFSEGFFAYLEKNILNFKNIKDNKNELSYIVQKCCEFKREVVIRDEKENGDRALLNFGHTIAHALEKTEDFNGYAHGEAVGVGMRVMCNISEALGGLTKAENDRIKSFFNMYQVPSEINREIFEEVLDNLIYDKKVQGNNIDIILLSGIGKSYIKNVSLDELRMLVKDNYGK